MEQLVGVLPLIEEQVIPDATEFLLVLGEVGHHIQEVLPRYHDQLSKPHAPVDLLALLAGDETKQSKTLPRCKYVETVPLCEGFVVLLELHLHLALLYDAEIDPLTMWIGALKLHVVLRVNNHWLNLGDYLVHELWRKHQRKERVLAQQYGVGLHHQFLSQLFAELSYDLVLQGSFIGMLTLPKIVQILSDLTLKIITNFLAMHVSAQYSTFDLLFLTLF